MASVACSTFTRARRRDLLAINALSVRIQRNTTINSTAALDDWLSTATVNCNIGSALEDLAINILADSGYPAGAVRRCLVLAPNLDTLVLLLPPTTPDSIFRGVAFTRLTVFSMNLPHRVIASFLAAHPSISGLILRACGRSSNCPLHGLHFRHLTSLRCPSRCFVGLSHDHQLLSSATVNLTRLASSSSIALQVGSTARLHTLTVDFFPSDYDILLRVMIAAPNLRKLKMNEKPRPQRRSQHVRRPWNNLQDWHRTLLRLPLLEELMLRMLISIAGGHRSEMAVILGWANGVTRRAVAHPSLYHIAVIQRDSGATQQILSHWFRRDAGAWARVSSRMIGPTHSFTM